MFINKVNRTGKTPIFFPFHQTTYFTYNGQTIWRKIKSLLTGQLGCGPLNWKCVLVKCHLMLRMWAIKEDHWMFLGMFALNYLPSNDSLSWSTRHRVTEKKMSWIDFNWNPTLPWEQMQFYGCLSRDPAFSKTELFTLNNYLFLLLISLFFFFRKVCSTFCDSDNEPNVLHNVT